MRVLLIRHGETVDNVASIWAGSRDSALTSHGMLQASKLGEHLVSRTNPKLLVKHVFSSDLQRASITAKATKEAFETELGGVTLGHTELKDLRERDFGILEGKSFKTKDSILNAEGLAEVRSAVKERVDRFLDDHLIPLLQKNPQPEGQDETDTCIVVSHGIVLGTLYSAIKGRASQGRLTLVPELQNTDGARGMVWWENTAYLECEMSAVPEGLVVRAIKFNCIEHLKNVSKTKGGIGSSKFDPNQSSMDAFLVKSKKPGEEKPGEEKPAE